VRRGAGRETARRFACAVDRIVCKGQTTEGEMAVDIASEEFAVREGERLAVLLTTTLDRHGKPDTGVYVPPGSGESTLLDDYDYGMYGKVFRVTHQGDGQLCVVRVGLRGARRGWVG
jgi:RNA polymerase Rpb8